MDTIQHTRARGIAWEERSTDSNYYSLTAVTHYRTFRGNSFTSLTPGGTASTTRVSPLAGDFFEPLALHHKVASQKVDKPAQPAISFLEAARKRTSDRGRL